MMTLYSINNFLFRFVCKPSIFFIVFILFENFDLDAQTLNQQAKIEVDNFKNSTYVNYSGDYFGMSRDFVINHSNPKDTSTWNKTLYQFKNLAFKIDSLSVFYLDSLNGYQWKGRLNIIASAFREIYWSNQPGSETGGATLPQAIWSKWYSFDTLHLYFFKYNGVWGGIQGQLNHLPERTDITNALLRPGF